VNKTQHIQHPVVQQTLIFSMPLNAGTGRPENGKNTNKSKSQRGDAGFTD